ncbi:unnamed protein product [Lathyrus sativus]|nr:unnamed protein product [Lathyrus sativus]
MESGKKKTFQIKAKVLDVKSLVFFSDELTNIHREAFTIKYGKILDPLLLAPTPEEFRRILESYKKRKGPYRGMRQFPKPKDIVEVLNLSVADLAHNIKTWGEVQEIPRE